MNARRLVVVCTGIVLLAGCGSIVDRRIAQHRDVWNLLSASDQARIRNGYFLSGDPAEAVIIALGPPDRKRVEQDSSGRSFEVWEYQELDGVSQLERPERQEAMNSAIPVGLPTAENIATTAAFRVDTRLPDKPPFTRPTGKTAPDRTVTICNGVVW